MNDTLLKVEDLKVYFPVRKKVFFGSNQYVYAVNGISFHLNKGETLGIVGESGCGKTTTGMTLLHLNEPTAGKIFYRNTDITRLAQMPKNKQMQIRKEIQLVFQDPYSSLNPRMTVREILEEPMIVHGMYHKVERRERIQYILNKVGLSWEQSARYPHQFSGGQRQRIGIARALVISPKIIIGDEPVSALDVSIQAQIINLLVDLQDEFDLSYIIISHDLAVVEHISDRIAVMYLGTIVESALGSELYNNPLHPYTKCLLSAIPVINPRVKRNRILLKGDVPNPQNPPQGCFFHPRCPESGKGCNEKRPQLQEITSDHFVACDRLV